jgi:hypothetical protein
MAPVTVVHGQKFVELSQVKAKKHPFLLTFIAFIVYTRVWLLCFFVANLLLWGLSLGTLFQGAHPHTPSISLPACLPAWSPPYKTSPGLGTTDSQVLSDWPWARFWGLFETTQTGHLPALNQLHQIQDPHCLPPRSPCSQLWPVLTLRNGYHTKPQLHAERRARKKIVLIKITKIEEPAGDGN